ncbi:hypothetical protein [Serpentinicella alkaliphila]|uniref:Uncharacterized protein n=1 Tax=Serpentinicella alkaliphila TaxID=1734049 RepID=A0A4R2TVR1_9FIRM|nr:hypothetical protein [Serpentinicella alkaliphila]QUH25233.1 hypothetical protein HZR23_05280 [Serpentinicella alkaliphila]TCQ07042.1 hypothetical protein EDD79_100238 [Serpentinicella alkaliphila]
MELHTKSCKVIFELHVHIRIWKWFFAIIITPLFLLSGGAFIVIFIESPFYYIVLYLLSMIVSIYIITELLFGENYIAENGIKYANQYYLWKEILNYNCKEHNDLVLELIIESKLLFLKHTYPVDINVSRNSLEEIKKLLDEKNNSISE